MRGPRLDLRHLLEELRDAQPRALEETIVAELVGLALQARAATIRLFPDPRAATLIVIDDGRGLQRKEMRAYNSMKGATRTGRTGTALPGAAFRLALLLTDELITETIRGATHMASSWHLGTRHRAPFKWIAPPGLVTSRGTAVRLKLSNPLSPLLDPGYLEEAIRTHFGPLFDPAFDALLSRHYPAGIRIEVDDRMIAARQPGVQARVTVPIRLGRERSPSAIAVLERHDVPLPEDRHGIAISTRGKVVRRGWDWLGLAPAAPFRITGLVEVPALGGSLVPDGGDFVRSGPGASAYVAHRKAIQAAVAEQLTAWGDMPPSDDRPRAVRLDRDVERAVDALAADFPPLRSLIEPPPDGQELLPLHGRSGPVISPVDATAGGCRLTMEFASRPEDTELGRLVGGVVSINDAHPAFLRAARSRSAGYHNAVAVAHTLASLVATSHERAFVMQFLASWGRADGGRLSERAPRERKPRP